MAQCRYCRQWIGRHVLPAHEEDCPDNPVNKEDRK
jgi:hypothetical protein